MHKNSYSKMEWFKNTYLSIVNNLEILDVGSLNSSGDYNYSSIFNEKNWHYTGLDIQGGYNVDIIVDDIYNWLEVENNSYDVIISGQFFEHLEFFWLTMTEIERVLKPGGYLCIIITSSDDSKHGDGMSNCYGFYEDGLRAMARYADLEVVHISIDTGDEVKSQYDACLVACKPCYSKSKDVKS